MSSTSNFFAKIHTLCRKRVSLIQKHNHSYPKLTNYIWQCCDLQVLFGNGKDPKKLALLLIVLKRYEVPLRVLYFVSLCISEAIWVHGFAITNLTTF